METVGVYVRISSDVLGEGLGVARQEQDCRALAERNGWHVREVYVDNDVSAFSGKARPAYERLLSDIKGGLIEGVVTWHPDRLHRLPRELEAFIDLIEATGCRVETVQSGRIDLSTPSGRLNARVIGDFARYESEHKSDRVRRKLQQNAEQGKSHGGSRPYGWENDRMTLREDEAETVRLATGMLLAGNSIKAIVRTLNERGSRNSLGGLWRDVTVRSMLARPRNAGLRVHHGEVVGVGQWTPILDRDTWEQARVILTDPARTTTPGALGRTHLLTGIARCGAHDCRAVMRVGKGKPYKGKAADVYRCKASACVSRDQATVDELVQRIVCARLARPDAVALLRHDEDDAGRAARAEVERLRSRLEVAAADYADDKIDADQLRTITARLRPQIEAAERRVPSPARRTAVLVGLAGQADVAQRWEKLDVSVRRKVVDLLVNVIILPTRRGPGFDPESVQVTWKAAA
jgi:site-specific DNA recombinase